MDIIKVFGTNVRKHRTEKIVSQEKLAELCGLHRTYISDIECFRRSISLDNIQKIADALCIETYKLFIEGEQCSMLDQIRDILLLHKGIKNRITSSEVADAVGIVEDITYAKTRALIFDCAKKYGLPLAADTKGYYLITCQKEYDDYIKNLNSRISGIDERKRVITQNYARWEDNNAIHTKK